jgi:hypothetical protein
MEFYGFQKNIFYLLDRGLYLRISLIIYLFQWQYDLIWNEWYIVNTLCMTFQVSYICNFRLFVDE